MSGHSHAKTIKHQKNLTDQKRGQMFSKMASMISVAVKQGGADPIINSRLQTAIERARRFNMPKDNIERAIEQALGGKEGVNLEEVIFEAYGPGGVAVIIEGITDNKNRALGEIKQILSQYGGKLAQEGSVRWMFQRMGTIAVLPKDQPENWQNKESLELKAIEAGAQDFAWQDEFLELYLPVDILQSTKSSLEKDGLKINSATADWRAKEEIDITPEDKEKAEKLFLALDENSDVQDVYSNLKG